MKVIREDMPEGDEIYHIAEKEIPSEDKRNVDEVLQAVTQLINPMVKEFTRVVQSIIPPLENTIVVLMDKDGNVASVLGTAPPEIQIKAMERALFLIRAMKKKKES